MIDFTPEIATRLGMRRGVPSVGRMQRFDVGTGVEPIKVGVWDRFATFGEGPDGKKVKGGDEVNFTPETFKAMIENWYGRGGSLPLCLDHSSALGGYVRAPAAAFYDAMAVVYHGQTFHFRKLSTSIAASPALPQLVEQVKKFATEDDPKPAPDGLWCFRSEVTPLGEHPTEGLRNYRGLSPFFIMDGTDEQDRPIGPVLFDGAAVNVQFQAGCELTMGQAMATNSLKCPRCGTLALADDGVFREHNDGNGARCPESGKRIAMDGAARSFSAKTMNAYSIEDAARAIGRDAVLDYQSSGHGVVRARIVGVDMTRKMVKTIDKDGFEASDPIGRVIQIMSGTERTLRGMTMANVFVGTKVRYRLDGREKTGTVAVVGSDEHLIHADGGGDDLVPSRDVTVMSASTGAARAFGGAMDPDTMKRFGFAEDDDDDAKTEKTKKFWADNDEKMSRLQKFEADAACKPGDEEPVKLDYDHGDPDQRAIVAIKEGWSTTEPNASKTSSGKLSAMAVLTRVQEAIAPDELAAAKETGLLLGSAEPITMRAAVTHIQAGKLVPVAEVAALRGEVQTMAAQINAARDEKIADAAAAYVDQQIADGRAGAKATAALVQAYSAAATLAHKPGVSSAAVAKAGADAVEPFLVTKGTLTLGKRLTSGGDPIGKPAMAPTDLSADTPDAIEQKIAGEARKLMAADASKKMTFSVACGRVLDTDASLRAQYRALRR